MDSSTWSWATLITTTGYRHAVWYHLARTDVLRFIWRVTHMFSAKPPTPARLEQWSRLRAAGKRHFILYYGLLKIGTYLFVVLGGWLFLMETGLILLLMGGTDLPVPLPLPEGRTKHTAALRDWDKTYRGCDGCGNQSAMLVVATAFRSIPLVRRACLATSGIGAFSHPFSGFRRTTTEPA